jgi:hypothetical protein
MTLKAMIAEWDSLEQQKKVLLQEIEVHKQNICNEHCTVKIGDAVISNGYSHSGKKMKVEKISFSRYWNVFRFTCEGKILKADGSESKNYGTHWVDVKERDL